MAKNQLMDAVRRLHIENGDVLAIQRGAISNEEAHALSERLTAMGKTNVLILAIADPGEIKHLKEIDMNRLGWFRATNIIPLRTNNQERGDGKEMPDEPIREADKAKKSVFRHRG